MKEQLLEIFKRLSAEIITENIQRSADGSRLVPGCKIEILGQISLLAQPELTYKLSLAVTGDLDAKLRADFFVKQRLKVILSDYGFIYDEDSPLVFIPEGSHFDSFVNLPLVEVMVIDPESALVSKAVKAPVKMFNY